MAAVMKRTFAGLLLPPAVFLIFFCINGRAEDMPDGINKLRLENGLVIITKKTTALPIATLRFFVRTGSAADPEDKKGLTNLMMAVLTKGTAKRTSDKIADEIESLGGGLGVGCVEDYCDIGLSISKKNIDKAFEVLADVMLNPVFPEEELAKEKTVVLAAIKSRQDHIFDVAFDTLCANVFGAHPYADLPLGKPEYVEKITRADLVGRHAKYLTAPNLVLAATGNVTPGEIKKLIAKYLSALRKDPAPQVLTSPVKPSKKTIREKKKFEQAYVMYGYVCPPVNSGDFPALKILDVYLGGGMSSLLFQELREKGGLGYEVHSFYQGRRYESPFVIYIGLDQKSIGTAEEKIHALLAGIKNKPAEPKRIEEAKNYLEGVYLLDHQSSSRQGWYLGRWEILGKGSEYDLKYVEDLKKVTPQDVMDAAKKYLTDDFVLVEIEAQK